MPKPYQRRLALLTDEQEARLLKLSAEAVIPVTELIRRAIDAAPDSALTKDVA